MTVELLLDLELVVPACGAAVSEQPDPLRLSTTIPYEEFRTGAPASFRVTQPVPELGDDAEIVLVLETTFLGETL